MISLKQALSSFFTGDEIADDGSRPLRPMILKSLVAVILVILIAGLVFGF